MSLFREVLRGVAEDYRLIWDSVRHPSRRVPGRVFVVLLIYLVIFTLASIYVRF